MTPEKRRELTTQLGDQGLYVIPTRDFDAILMQLARLAQFERMMLTVAAGNPAVEFAVEHVQCEQQAPPHMISDAAALRPLTTLDIPTVLNDVNRALHDQLDKQAHIDPLRAQAAALAFVGILRAEG